jgi:ribosomal protein L29
MKKTIKDIKDKNTLLQLDKEGLFTELNKAKQEFYVLKMKYFSNELKQTHLLKVYRKYISRLNTLINVKNI